MADFVPHTKYDIGSQYYAVVADLMARAAYYGIDADSYDPRALMKRLSTLKQWLRCISPVACKKTLAGDFIYDADLLNVAGTLKTASMKISGSTIKNKQTLVSLINEMNDAEMRLLLIMKKYKMLTKFETGITNEDRLRDEMGVRGSSSVH